MNYYMATQASGVSPSDGDNGCAVTSASFRAHLRLPAYTCSLPHIYSIIRVYFILDMQWQIKGIKEKKKKEHLRSRKQKEQEKKDT